MEIDGNNENIDENNENEDENNENEDRWSWKKDEVWMLLFWKLEWVLRSLIKQNILIGQMTGQDLHNQMIAIWRGG